MERPEDWCYLDEAEHVAVLAERAGLDDPNLLDHIQYLIGHGLLRLTERDQSFPTFRPHGSKKVIGA